MITFVPFAVTYQTELPPAAPRFCLSILEIGPGFGISTAAFLQLFIWVEEDSVIYGWDILWTTWLINGWNAWQAEKEGVADDD